MRWCFCEIPVCCLLMYLLLELDSLGLVPLSLAKKIQPGGEEERKRNFFHGKSEAVLGHIAQV